MKIRNKNIIGIFWEAQMGVIKKIEKWKETKCENARNDETRKVYKEYNKESSRQ